MALPQHKDGDRARPRILPGFEGIKSYWDSTHHYYSARVQPGEYYVSCGEEIITTTLGSCVSACIRDTRISIGGMNHFMLPESGGAGAPTNDSMRYGSFAMENMINTILANGGSRNSLEVKLFGGGRVMKSMTDVGQRNIEFVRNYLKEEGIRIDGEDLGGIHPRKIIYFPFNGKVLLRKLPNTSQEPVISEEERYRSSIQKAPVSGDIDLF